jgi:hypothetical protein
MGEKILTLHPEGKDGVNISRAKYTLIRNSILSFLSENTQLTFTELIGAMEHLLEGTFEGSIPWYVTTVKLDLEARKVIERVPGSKPQLLRIAEDSS